MRLDRSLLKSAMESYSIDSMIQGYHVYKDIWLAPIGAVLRCQRERFNPVILTLLTSGFTILFTTSIQEEGIVADNDPQAEILVLSLFI